MISISMTTADINGSVILKDGASKFGSIPARVSKIATLDGGCVMVSSGVSDADRTFRISTTINSEQKAKLEYIHKNSTQVLIACSFGLFLGGISNMDTSRPKITITILIKSREDSE